MNTHVKVVAWLWIANGILSILLAIAGLTAINWPGAIPGLKETLLATIGALCFFLPGIVAYLLAGYGLLHFRPWARILAIIMAILNLIFFPIGTTLGIYTLWVMFKRETKALFEVVS